MGREDESAQEPSGAQADVIVNTLEALQARIAESDRERMRGAIAPERPPAGPRGDGHDRR